MKFTFQYIKDQLLSLQELEYDVITCEQYVHAKQTLSSKTIVLRVDIDFSLKKTAILLDIMRDLGIKSTFFLRLHAPEYNPLSFESHKIVKRIIDEGHELGYHSEIVDQAAIWNEDPEECLIRDLKTINSAFGVEVKGVASHGGSTGLNNLDFWKHRKPSDYGLLYEGYDKEPAYNLFQEAFYISDSEWTQWKAYDKGKLVVEDRRSPAEHAAEGHELIHLLIHPDTYYFNHIYE